MNTSDTSELFFTAVRMARHMVVCKCQSTSKVVQSHVEMKCARKDVRAVTARQQCTVCCTPASRVLLLHRGTYTIVHCTSMPDTYQICKYGHVPVGYTLDIKHLGYKVLYLCSLGVHHTECTSPIHTDVDKLQVILYLA